MKRSDLSEETELTNGKLDAREMQVDTRGLSGKSSIIGNNKFAQHQCNQAAKESGLEYTCMNNDDFTVLRQWRQ